MLGVAIYQQIRENMLLGFPKRYNSDNPLCHVRPHFEPRCTDLSGLCALAGVAIVASDAERLVLFGRESMLVLVHQRLEAGEVDTDAVQRAFDADWGNTRGIPAHDEMIATRDRIFNLPMLAHKVAGLYPQLRNWGVKGECQLVPHGGPYSLGGIFTDVHAIHQPSE